MVPLIENDVGDDTDLENEEVKRARQIAHLALFCHFHCPGVQIQGLDFGVKQVVSYFEKGYVHYNIIMIVPTRVK